MPSREEERSINKKSGQRYCAKHQTYYYEEFGCQQCAFEDFKPKSSAEPNQSLKNCPRCKRASLFWNSQNGIYECLNKKCKRQFTVQQVAEAEAKGKLDTNDGGPKRNKRKH